MNGVPNDVLGNIAVLVAARKGRMFGSLPSEPTWLDMSSPHSLGRRESLGRDCWTHGNVRRDSFTSRIFLEGVCFIFSAEPSDDSLAMLDLMDQVRSRFFGIVLLRPLDVTWSQGSQPRRETWKDTKASRNQNYVQTWANGHRDSSRGTD